MAHYAVRIGEREDELPDNLSVVINFMLFTLDDLHGRLPEWRFLALQQQIADMPRAGISFTLDDGSLVRVARVK